VTISNRPYPVAFVGAGPSDPELITRKGWWILGQADFVLYDALIDVEGFREAAPRARWINVGKRLGRISTAQPFISKSLVNLALRGYRVVRLKGGDPTIFGRLTEEVEACRSAGLDITIVPGVTAASACATELGISLTQRGVSRSVTLLTPRVSQSGALSEDWVSTALLSDTIVLYMAGAELSAVAQALLIRGKNPKTPVAIIESAGRAVKKTALTLRCCLDVAPETSGGPLTVLIGQVVASAAEFQRRFDAQESGPIAQAQ